MIIHLTHTDLDGAGCAILMQRAEITKKENTYFVDYSDLKKKLSELPSDIHLILTDLSVDETTRKILDRFPSLMYFDHHATSVGFKRGIVDTNECGTTLVNNYLKGIGIQNKENDRLAALIKDHDLWIRELPEKDKLSCLFSILGEEKLIDTLVRKNVDDVLRRYSSNIDSMIKYRDDYVNSKVPIIPRYRRGNECIILATKHHNMIAERFFKEGYDPVFIADMERMKFSIRSQKYDVSKFAEKNGGGGHPKASGIVFSNIMIDSIIDTIYSLLINEKWIVIK